MLRMRLARGTFAGGEVARATPPLYSGQLLPSAFAAPSAVYYSLGSGGTANQTARGSSFRTDGMVGASGGVASTVSMGASTTCSAAAQGVVAPIHALRIVPPGSAGTMRIDLLIPEEVQYGQRIVRHFMRSDDEEISDLGYTVAVAEAVQPQAAYAAAAQGLDLPTTKLGLAGRLARIACVSGEYAGFSDAGDGVAVHLVGKFGNDYIPLTSANVPCVPSSFRSAEIQYPVTDYSGWVIVPPTCTDLNVAMERYWFTSGMPAVTGYIRVDLEVMGPGSGPGGPQNYRYAGSGS